MIDYFKVEICNYDSNLIRLNSRLDFFTKVSTKTGEVVGSYESAYYRGLEFRLYKSTSANPTGRITLEGSLHKYSNNGAHNFNDFSLQEVKRSLESLEKTFGFDWGNTRFLALEIGINLTPPVSSLEILKACMYHKTKLFKWVSTRDEGRYIQALHQRHIIKIYDKRQHYQVKGYYFEKEVLRFEKKWLKTEELKGWGISNFPSLMNIDFSFFIEHLALEWDRVLFVCSKSLKGHKEYYQFSSPAFWASLSYNQFKYQRKRLRGILEEESTNLHQSVKNQIRAKGRDLIGFPKLTLYI